MILKNISDWFVDNNLSSHVGEDKTKSILPASQCKSKNIKKLNINYRTFKENSIHK